VDDSIVRARAFDRNKVSNAGSSKHTRGGILLNGGYPIGQKTELFWTAAANHRKTQFISGYTFPKNTNRVNPELFPDGFGARPITTPLTCPALPVQRAKRKKAGIGNIAPLMETTGTAYFIKNTNNPSQYFTLGKAAPTSFYTGTLVYGQLTNNLHLSKKFLAKQGRTLHLGAGAEWRLEKFRDEGRRRGFLEKL
jgi:iron complex outermembrane receptor protein